MCIFSDSSYTQLNHVFQGHIRNLRDIQKASSPSCSAQTTCVSENPTEENHCYSFTDEVGTYILTRIKMSCKLYKFQIELRPQFIAQVSGLSKTTQMCWEVMELSGSFQRLELDNKHLFISKLTSNFLLTSTN